MENLQGKVCTLRAINRKISDPRPIGRHRETTSCEIDELTDTYAKLKLIDQNNKIVTIPFADIIVSFDDKGDRPMIELRAI